MAFRSADRAEGAQADFIVCLRLADLPTIASLPPSVQAHARQTRRESERVPCEGCGQPVLRSRSNPTGPKTVCTHCHRDIKALASRAAGTRN